MIKKEAAAKLAKLKAHAGLPSQVCGFEEGEGALRDLLPLDLP